MLKREIKYEDFNGENVSEVVYFNISKPELIELEVEFNEGYGKMLERIIETKDNRELIKRFKEIVLLAYGVKSDDGRRFMKSDALREEFSQTAAYQELYMDIASNDNAAVEFLTGILPKDLRGELVKTVTETSDVSNVPSGAPIPPNK